MTPNARFTEFIKDITPSETTVSNCKSAHTAVRGAVLNGNKFKVKVNQVFLGSSYRRSTAIRPATKNGTTGRLYDDHFVVVEGAPLFSDPVELIDDLYGIGNRNMGTSPVSFLHCLGKRWI